MVVTAHFAAPIGGITLAAEDGALIGLWFDGQRHFGSVLSPGCREGSDPVLDQALVWLEDYFSAGRPGAPPALRLDGTPFQRRVWALLRSIPYGTTVSYGQLARRLSRETEGGLCSPRAVGTAVGRNPVSLIVPCHRVVGADGRLTGYAGGLEKKRWLLDWERRHR